MFIIKHKIKMCAEKNPYTYRLQILQALSYSNAPRFEDENQSAIVTQRILIRQSRGANYEIVKQFC
jgi:hypothetical protein